MSRTLSFRGQLAIGVEERISLHTNTGQTGYQITKFQILSSAPGAANLELIAQIYKTPDELGGSNINTTPDFSNNRLLAVSYMKERAGDFYGHGLGPIIFDNEIFNQDVYINITDAAGGTTPCNYYIEMEQMDLALDESTVATLKDIRNAGSQ